MRPTKKDIAEEQQRYYTRTAGKYDDLHLHEKDEHYFALSLLRGVLDYLDARSILDIGSGTGRALIYLKNKRPDLKIIGVEPVTALREVGYTKGLSKDELVPGDAQQLAFSDGEFDIVCEFGVLHHIRDPARVVAEMLRVAKKAIFISDANNFGQGSVLKRGIKQTLHTFGMWRLARYLWGDILYSEADGISYSYSVFDNYKQIRCQCSPIYLFNTRGEG